MSATQDSTSNPEVVAVLDVANDSQPTTLLAPLPANLRTVNNIILRLCQLDSTLVQIGRQVLVARQWGGEVGDRYLGGKRALWLTDAENPGDLGIIQAGLNEVNKAVLRAIRAREVGLLAGMRVAAVARRMEERVAELRDYLQEEPIGVGRWDSEGEFGNFARISDSTYRRELGDLLM